MVQLPILVIKISFGTNNLVTTGTLNTGNAVGVLNTGNVVTTGTNTVSSNLNVSGSSLLSNVTVNNGQITSSTGTLGFSDNNVKTTGTLESGNLTVTGNIGASGSLTTDSVNLADFTISDGLITNSSGAISFDNENLTTTGDISAENISATTVTVGGEQINSSEASLINNITNVGFSQNSKAVTQSSTGVSYYW